MKRKEFIKASAMLLGAAAPGTVHAAANDAALVKQIVADYYRLFFVDVDKDKYRALLTDDYLCSSTGTSKISRKIFRSCPSPPMSTGERMLSISNH